MIDFGSIVPGMHFKVVDQWRNPRGTQNWSGAMDEWLGRELTVKYIRRWESPGDYFDDEYLVAEEDDMWEWFDDLIDYVVELDDSEELSPSDQSLEDLLS